jgi:multiple sugar transport system permease protein
VPKTRPQGPWSASADAFVGGDVAIAPASAAGSSTLAAPPSGQGKTRRHLGPVGRRPLWLVAPAIALLALLVVLPVGLDVYISFRDVIISTLRHWLTAPWAGIQNYVQAISSPSPLSDSFTQSLVISVTFSIVTTLISAPIGFIAALSVNHRFRGRALFRSLFLVPYVIPVFVTGFVARLMFQNGTGLIDRVLGATHLASQNTYWLLGPNTFWALVISDVWLSWPFIYIMTLAGLSSVPIELYDAADLDGAGNMSKIRHVVLPQLRSLLWLALLLSTIYHFGSFTLPFILFGNAPPAQANVLPVDIYFRAFTSFQYGIAAATAVFTLAIMVVPGYIYLRSTRLGGDNKDA